MSEKPPCDRRPSHGRDATGQKTNMRFQKRMAQDTLGRTHKPPLSDDTREDTTENLTQDPDFEPYHHSQIRASSCEATDVQEDGNASSNYPVGSRQVNITRTHMIAPCKRGRWRNHVRTIMHRADWNRVSP